MQKLLILVLGIAIGVTGFLGYYFYSETIVVQQDHQVLQQIVNLINSSKPQQTSQ